MKLLDEKLELLSWFDIYYTQHEQKYRRLQTLGKMTDDGKDTWNELLGLYAQAETKRARLKEIESLDNIK